MISENERDNNNNETTKNKRVTISKILRPLDSFYIIRVFPNLNLAHNLVNTIFGTLVSEKRYFSKSMLIKIRIQSTMIQNRVENLVLLTEKYITNTINLNEAIDKYT